MKPHLNFCFPEWQGYAESNDVYHGALAVQKALDAKNNFEIIEVPEYEELPLEKDILGYQANLRQLRSARSLLADLAPKSTFMIGGTCAAEIAPVSYLNHIYDGDLAVIWFDAHGDLNTPQSSPSKHFHGMPLRALLGESEAEILKSSFSLIKPDQVVLAGTRDLDVAEKEFIDKNRLAVCTPESIEALPTYLDQKQYNHVYLHVDLDVLDAKEFPHLLLPVTGGLSIQGLLDKIKTIRDAYEIVGSSIVEYVPQDGEGIDTIRRLVRALGV